MANINMFPTNPGFLFPDGEFYSTDGKGHERLAYRILKERFNEEDVQKLSDAEYFLQADHSAMLIRYRWGEKLIYLPQQAPNTFEGKVYFLKAIKFYKQNGYKILNLYKISLSIGYHYDYHFKVKEFFVEDFEFIKKDLIGVKFNYTNTVVVDKSGKYTYNPERIGD